MLQRNTLASQRARPGRRAEVTLGSHAAMIKQGKTILPRTSKPHFLGTHVFLHLPLEVFSFGKPQSFPGRSLDIVSTPEVVALIHRDVKGPALIALDTGKREERRVTPDVGAAAPIEQEAAGKRASACGRGGKGEGVSGNGDACALACGSSLLSTSPAQLHGFALFTCCSGFPRGTVLAQSLST